MFLFFNISLNSGSYSHLLHVGHSLLIMSYVIAGSVYICWFLLMTICHIILVCTPGNVFYCMQYILYGTLLVSGLSGIPLNSTALCSVMRLLFRIRSFKICFSTWLVDARVLLSLMLMYVIVWCDTFLRTLSDVLCTTWSFNSGWLTHLCRNSRNYLTYYFLVFFFQYWLITSQSHNQLSA